ncbi:MAG TPA: type II toxin-antitoxin system VapC family toxin [Pseudolabrys sp.]
MDASATIALLLNENDVLAVTDQLYRLSEEQLVAPSHWAAEVGNSLVVNTRRGRLKASDIDKMIERLNRFGIEPAPTPSFEEVAAIAHCALSTGLTYYDAAYVHAAQIRQAMLLTLDQKMRKVAAELNIPLFAW